MLARVRSKASADWRSTRPCAFGARPIHLPISLAKSRRSRGPIRQRIRRTPILALTANTLVEDRYACFEAGMDGFLVKPLDREKLADALAGLVASRHIAA